MTTAHTKPIDPATAQAVQLFLRRAALQFAVRDGILFGSRARGYARRDSDADVAVVLDGRRGKFMQTKLAMADIAFDTLLDTGIHVQPLPVWASEWNAPESWWNPELLRTVKRTGVSVWPPTRT
ncbi:MAG TPA: nucleotidyltransferase domain-containing protein [Rhodanobacteraceae bacterium]